MKEKKNNRFRQLETRFNEDQQNAREKIKQEPNRLKRFFKWVLHLIVFPWKWIFVNIQDWRTALIFVIVVLVVSSEVWVSYLIYFITNNAWFLGIGSACWLFWLGPGTPFLIICIGLTILIKGLFNKLKEKKYDNNRKTRNQG